MLLAGVALLLGLSAVAGGGIEPDPACGPCHPDTATTDAHAGTGCYACHADPGAVPRAARLVLDASYALRGPASGRVEASVSDRACLSCHTSVMREPVFADGIRMSHRTCVGRESGCTGCHSDAAHGRISADRAISMDRCSRCHDGTAAPKTCETCHFGEPTRTDALNAWAVTHGRNRHETHGMGDLRTCTVCHKPADCTECHLPVPHAADWPGRHGAEAIRVGRDACLACHVGELCDGCHGMPMPHPAGWLPEHSGAVDKDDAEARCKGCHAVSDCRDCHLAHVHPGLERAPGELRAP